jgi:predicted nucleotide-binding protein
MEKRKLYRRVRFPSKTLRRISYSISNSENFDHIKIYSLKCNNPDESWNYDSVPEFLAEYGKYPSSRYFSVSSDAIEISYSFYPYQSEVSVRANRRSDIDAVFLEFERDLEDSNISGSNESGVFSKIFIGHGRSRDWKELKDHLQDQHSYSIQSFESGARAGHTIRDILESLVDSSSFAILVMTAEDEQPVGSYRARQNVIHEVGLFQGRLGFGKVVMVVEQGVEIPSNLAGIQVIEYEKNRIRETFGDVLATIRREIPE